MTARKPGRPRFYADGRVIFSTSLPPSTIQRLRQDAAASGMTMASYLTKIIDDAHGTVKPGRKLSLDEALAMEGNQPPVAPPPVRGTPVEEYVDADLTSDELFITPGGC